MRELQTHTAEEILTTVYKPIEFIIEGLLAQGLYILAGAQKIGKSWLALDICLSVATGADVLQRKTVRGTVLYLCLEDNYNRIQDRLYKMNAAEKAFSKYECVVATHIDRDHIHSHFVFNSVSFEDGKKYHSNLDTVTALMKLSDEICAKYGVPILNDPDNQSPKKKNDVLTDREYRSAKKGESFKFELMNAINQAMKQAKTKRQFCWMMRQYGYGVRWEDNRKYITYTCPNGRKCRCSKLHGERYGKEMMELEFEIRRTESAVQQGIDHGSGCNSHHRYGKQYCTPHRIHEEQLDELVQDEVRLLLLYIKELCEQYDQIIRDWMRQKPQYEQRIQQYTNRISILKEQVENLIMERINDRARAATYTDMIEKREHEIKELEHKIVDCHQYDAVSRRKRDELKSTADLLEDILSKPKISDANLRILLQRVYVHQNEDKSLTVRFVFNADFDDSVAVYVEPETA